MVVIKGKDEPILAEDVLVKEVIRVDDENLKDNRFNIRNKVGMDQIVKT